MADAENFFDKPDVDEVLEEPETVPDWVFDLFSARRIGARVVNLLGITAAVWRFADGTRDAALAFAHTLAGVVTGHTYRHRRTAEPLGREIEGEPVLFNAAALDRVAADPTLDLVWCDDELEVAALCECGLSAVSCGDDDFGSLRTHATHLERVRKVVLALPTTPAGLATREELARRLGRHRCYLVAWPEGCVDAGRTLIDRGPDAVLAAISAAVPYPIEGLQRITAGVLLNLRSQPAPAVMGTGARGTDATLQLPTEGRLIIVTGWPNMGKSVWLRFVMVHTAADHARRWAVFSPEMQPWEQFAAECAAVYAGKPFWPAAGLDSMTETEVAEAGAWLGQRVTMIVSDAEAAPPTLDWILERAAAAVLRDGVTDFELDPWNEVAHQRGNLSETDYIGQCLQRIKAFCQRYGCNAWVVVHPAKPMPLKPGEKRGAPGPYDCAGSANWANKADLGLTVHSPQAGAAEVHVWKARYRRWGRRGAIGALEYDELTGRYSTPLAAASASDPVERGHWQESEG